MDRLVRIVLVPATAVIMVLVLQSMANADARMVLLVHTVKKELVQIIYLAAAVVKSALALLKIQYLVIQGPVNAIANQVGAIKRVPEHVPFTRTVTNAKDYVIARMGRIVIP